MSLHDWEIKRLSAEVARLECELNRMKVEMQKLKAADTQPQLYELSEGFNYRAFARKIEPPE